MASYAATRIDGLFGKCHTFAGCLGLTDRGDVVSPIGMAPLTFNEGTDARIPDTPAVLIHAAIQRFDAELRRRGGSDARRRSAVNLIRRVADHFGWQDTRDVNSHDIRAWLTRLIDDGAANGTHNDQLKKLRLFGGFLADVGELTENPARPISFVRANYGDGSEPMPADKLERLSRHLLERGTPGALHRRDAYRFVFFTTLRENEVTRALVGDVSLERRAFHLRAEISKTGRARWIPLGQDALEIARRHSIDRPRDHALFRPFPKRDTFKKDCRAAGMVATRIGYNSLRSGFILTADAAGWTAMQIAKVTGHVDPNGISKVLFRHYYKPSLGEIRRLDNLLPATNLGDIATVAKENSESCGQIRADLPYTGAALEIPMVAIVKQIENKTPLAGSPVLVDRPTAGGVLSLDPLPDADEGATLPPIACGRSSIGCDTAGRDAGVDAGPVGESTDNLDDDDEPPHGRSVPAGIDHNITQLIGQQSRLIALVELRTQHERDS